MEGGGFTHALIYTHFSVLMGVVEQAAWVSILAVLEKALCSIPIPTDSSPVRQPLMILSYPFFHKAVPRRMPTQGRLLWLRLHEQRTRGFGLGFDIELHCKLFLCVLHLGSNTPRYSQRI